MTQMSLFSNQTLTIQLPYQTTRMVKRNSWSETGSATCKSLPHRMAPRDDSKVFFKSFTYMAVILSALKVCTYVTFLYLEVCMQYQFFYDFVA